MLESALRQLERFGNKEKRQEYESFARQELNRTGIDRGVLSSSEQALFDLTIDSVGEALFSIHLQFEKRRGEEQYFEYHNTDHTKTVIQNTLLLLATVHRIHDPDLSDPTSLENLLIGMIEASWHDVVQDYKKQEKTIGLIHTLKRIRPAQPEHRSWGQLLTNERKSAYRLNNYLRKNRALQKLSDRALELLRPEAVILDIETTIPSFGEYPGSHVSTVYQPNLHENSSMIAKALAFADLAGVGWMEAQAYIQDSRRNLREEDLDIYTMVYQDHYISALERENILARIEAFFEREIAFIEGRFIAFQQEVGVFGEASDEVRALYPNFQSSDRKDDLIRRVRQNQVQLLHLSFRRLMSELGYAMGDVVVEGVPAKQSLQRRE